MFMLFVVAVGWRPDGGNYLRRRLRQKELRATITRLSEEFAAAKLEKAF